MSEENKALARRFFEEVWNEGNLDAADEILDASFVAHGLGIELPPGPAGFKQFVSAYRNAYPDVHFTDEDMIAEGDKVVTRWTARGTHKGELMGIPATGKQVEVTGIGILRISGGKAVEEWTNWDALGMLQQLGVVPPPGGEWGVTLCRAPFHKRKATRFCQRWLLLLSFWVVVQYNPKSLVKSAPSTLHVNRQWHSQA